MVADRRHGIATSVLANVNRDSKRKPDAYKADDFIPWRQDSKGEADGELHADPEAQSKLLIAKFAKLKG